MKRIFILLMTLFAFTAYGADVKISNLPEATTLADTDVFPVVAGTTTSKVQVTNLKTILATHAAITLSSDLGANLLGLSTQQLTLDNQTANYVFAGPTTGSAAAPSFRALVAADIPSLVATYQPLDTELTALAGLTSAANAIPYFTGSGTAGVISSSSDMVSLLGSADYATALSSLGGQASDSALTTLSSKTFSKTALTGTGGLDTILYDDLADGDIGMVGTSAGIIYWYVFEDSSSAAESSPSVIKPDDAGANTGRWLLKLYCDGSSCTVPQAATGAASRWLEGSANGTDYMQLQADDDVGTNRKITLSTSVTNAEDLSITLGANDNTVTIGTSTGVTSIGFGAIGLATTGTISGGSLTPVIGDADDFDNNFTGANLYGGTYIVNAAGSVILPNAGVGMNFTIVLETTGDTIIEPLATGTDDTIYMNGLAAEQGESIHSTTRGAMCVFQYRAADTWMATCNGFAEATPP